MRPYGLYALALAVLLASPVAAAVREIPAGIDIWYTRGDGSTAVDFAKMPIPSGFFCQRSEPFSGRVVLQGKPLATGLPGGLGATDTIVERLDSATFDRRGVAFTRVQMRALQLESVTPIKTACGDYNLRLNLSGRQPITRLRITRDSEKGGHFSAPIGVNLKISLTPVAGVSSQRLELFYQMRLAANPAAPWSANLDKRYRGIRGPLVVDTDGDQVPDTAVPSTSPNFVAGLDASLNKDELICHEEAHAVHCTMAT